MKTEKDAKTVLEVKNLSLKDGYKDCSFSTKSGEILFGIRGLLGSGRTELAETIFGIHKADSGQIILEGREVSFKNLQEAMANGIGYVPPERNVMGLFMDQSISDNISVTRWKDARKGLMMDQTAGQPGRPLSWRTSIKIGNLADNMRTLSGGNAQKCVLAKWLAHRSEGPDPEWTDSWCGYRRQNTISPI